MCSEDSTAIPEREILTMLRPKPVRQRLTAWRSWAAVFECCPSCAFGVPRCSSGTASALRPSPVDAELRSPLAPRILASASSSRTGEAIGWCGAAQQKDWRPSSSSAAAQRETHLNSLTLSVAVSWTVTRRARSGSGSTFTATRWVRVEAACVWRRNRRRNFRNITHVFGQLGHGSRAVSHEATGLPLFLRGCWCHATAKRLQRTSYRLKLSGSVGMLLLSGVWRPPVLFWCHLRLRHLLVKTEYRIVPQPVEARGANNNGEMSKE